jgi:mannose-6-phosphate isomerase-like protein (cupin superfamily)
VKVAITRPDGGEAIQLGPIRMRILEDGSTTGHRLGVGEITLPPHTKGPPQHRHAGHDEGFYVVSGTASFTVGDTTHNAPAGTLVMVPLGLRTPSPTLAMSPRYCSTRSRQTCTCSTSETSAT